MALVSVFPSTAHSVKKITPSSCLPLLRNQLEEQLKRQNFIFTRGFEEYLSLFGKQVFQDLLETENAHWIDMGAGAALAQRQFLKLERIETEKTRFTLANGRYFTNLIPVYSDKEIPHQVKVTALGFKKPPGFSDQINRAIRDYEGQFDYIETGYIEDFDSSALELADLVTSAFGTPHYSLRLSLALKTELTPLKMYGRWITNIHCEKKRGKVRLQAPDITIYNKNGRPIRFEDYLNLITGVQLGCINDYLSLLRTARNISVPSLEIISGATQGNGVPTARSFQMN